MKPLLDNNNIVSDFNFVGLDIDKGQGMGQQDYLIKHHSEDSNKKTRIVKPFREQNHTTKTGKY